MAVIGELEVLISASTGNLISALSTAESKFGSFAKTLSTGQMNLKTFGLATTAVGVGILAVTAAIAGNAISAASDWNKQLIQVGNNAGMSSKDISYMGQQVLQLAAQTGASKTDLLDAFMHIHNMAFYGAAGMDVLTAATKEAVATGSDVSTVANTLAMAMHEFNIPAKDAMQTMDQLHMAAAESNMTIQDMVTSFGTVGATASAIGVPMKDALSVFAALTRNGINASESATQLRTMMLRMVDPTKGMTAELEKLSGGTASYSAAVSNGSVMTKKQITAATQALEVQKQQVEETKKANDLKYQEQILQTTDKKQKAELRTELQQLNIGYDNSILAINRQITGNKQLAIGAVSSKQALSELSKTSGVDLVYDFSQAGLKSKGLVGVLEDVKKATGGNVSEMEKLMPNMRGVLGLMIATGKGNKDMIDIYNSLNSSIGSTDKAYKAYSQTTAAQSARMKQELGNLNIAIGTALLPSVNKLLEAVLPLIQSFAVWAERHQTLVAGILAGVAALGALLTILGIITTAIGIFTTLTAASGLVIAGVTLPVWAVVAAVAALVIGVGIAAIFIATHFTQIKNAVGDAITFIKNNFIEILGYITGNGLLGTALQALSDHWTIIIKTIQNAWTSFTSVFGGEINKILGFLDGMISKAKNALSYLNPFARHSPSLVEQVTQGMGIIKQQYLSVGNVQMPKITMPAIAQANSQSYNTTNTRVNNVTMNNAFTVSGSASAANVADYMGFELEHYGIV